MTKENREAYYVFKVEITEAEESYLKAQWAQLGETKPVKYLYTVWFLQIFSLVFSDILKVWFPQVGDTEAQENSEAPQAEAKPGLGPATQFSKMLQQDIMINTI
jgi:hypothetical protein